MVQVSLFKSIILISSLCLAKTLATAPGNTISNSSATNTSSIEEITADDLLSDKTATPETKKPDLKPKDNATRTGVLSSDGKCTCAASPPVGSGETYSMLTDTNQTTPPDAPAPPAQPATAADNTTSPTSSDVSPTSSDNQTSSTLSFKQSTNVYFLVGVTLSSIQILST
ncbi:secreted protein [Melampsora americana]|nr:secreted protein [Melampsora americana]